MCGITGLVTFDRPTNAQPPDRAERIVRAMTETLRHRGPDADGIWCGPYATLGHTRLEILDVAGGAQPMLARRTGGGLVVLTFSGEVYNHDDLRASLAAAGQSFETRSDTEVVLRAYLEWGEDFVHRLRGMYAFALWDADAERLLLVRDRFGIKPLYFARAGDDLVFGSEIKALLAHPGLPARLTADGLGELLALPPMTSPGHGVLDGVEEVPPATVIRFGRTGLARRRYWTLESREHHDDPAATARRVRALLERAVREQVVADVPVGALNSGGLDSSAAAALAAAELGGELATFDVLHAGGAASTASSFHRSDDHPWALLVAEHVKSRHRTIEVSTQDLVAAQAATRTAMDLPSLTPINASLYQLFHRIAPHRRVVLSGEGSDEIFAGYRWHDLASGLAPAGRFPWATTYRPLTGLLTDETVHHVHPQVYAHQRYLAALSDLPLLAGEAGPARRLREVKWLTMAFYLPFLLRRTDRLSMASSVEVRVPFLDHDLVQYAWNIPGDRLRRRAREKGPLREAVEDLLPASVAWRPKSGYPASLTAGYQAAVWQQARDLLGDTRSPVLRLVSAPKLSAMLDAYEGDLTEWTPLQHVAYVLEVDAWLREHRVALT
ncbi:asparagine synthase (glutamine-hydrolyzing) [Hamadaea tsunoensis]|uniref:asparagine synthase (glutamine-hydrolyzing) n=1 Tax=Hamadaea tsunoensis TaxID=53368 RepID=UPI00040E940F|nr:asparagine synthase (glutamine-hydrolyzing) [Hamadaea tsunoensis]